MESHRSYDIDKQRSGCVAVCDCGWRSERSYSAGTAGAAWDRHVVSAVRERRRAVIAEALERVRSGPPIDIAPDVIVLDANVERLPTGVAEDDLAEA